MESKAKNNPELITNLEQCFHCGLPLKKSIFTSSLEGETRSFCCNGCKTAYELILTSGAECYYNNRDNFSEKPVNQSKSYPYQSEEFRKLYIKEEGDILRSVALHLDNIHCPSCIWVIEKVLETIDGVKEVSVNFTTHKVKVKWDESKLSIQHIVDTLSRVGYPPTPVEKINEERKFVDKNRALLARVAVSGFGTLATMFLSEPFYFSYIQDLDITSSTFLQYMLLVLSTPIFLYCITPFFQGIKTALKYRLFTMDLTIFLGAVFIFFYSTFAVLLNNPPFYFDCLNMFLFLILAGRLFESSIQAKVFAEAEKAIKLNPKQALVLKDDKEILTHINDIKIDDILIIKPGEQVPVDGIITYGKSYVNEAVVTGESKPIEKKEHDNVLAGSINLEGSFYLKTLKLSSESTLKKISDLADNIRVNKSFIQTFADKVANIFVSIILFLSLGVFLYYYPTNLEYAVFTSISVLIVSCPCALGLATPAVISLAFYKGINKGILFKQADSFEKINKVNHIVFDKTGTLTSGNMELNEVKTLTNITEEKLLEIASSIERYSEHPIGWAIVAEATKRKVALTKATDFKAFTGKGIEGTFNKTRYILGNLKFIEENNIFLNDAVKELSERAYTTVFLADEKEILGCFYLSDKIKEHSLDVINNLKEKNIELSLLSGDKREITSKIGKSLNIANIVSDVLPEQKSDYIYKLKEKHFSVAMIGDGINDTPALVQADVGISIFNNNNDLANINSDIILLNKDFYSVLEVFKLSKLTDKIIKENLVISLIYNLIVIPFAILGYITPLWAALLMPVSSMVVLINSCKIYWSK